MRDLTTIKGVRACNDFLFGSRIEQFKDVNICTRTKTMQVEVKARAASKECKTFILKFD